MTNHLPGDIIGSASSVLLDVIVREAKFKGLPDKAVREMAAAITCLRCENQSLGALHASKSAVLLGDFGLLNAENAIEDAVVGVVESLAWREKMTVTMTAMVEIRRGARH